MGRRRFQHNINHNSEFDLDLAPLLAVMVKLVPVLLVSSAFVQMMIIETDLPQVVQQALTRQAKNPESARVLVELSREKGVRIVVTEKGNQQIEQVNLNDKKEFDLPAVQSRFQQVKKQHPEIFKIELSPAADVTYNEIVKIMDEARRVKGEALKFPVKDESTGVESSTDYMFPEINFANVLEG